MSGHWFILSVLMLSGMWGCNDMQSSITTPSAPFFTPTSEELPRLAKITRELDTKALECLKTANCEHLYYSRALVGLFEDREAARTSFRHVIQHNPASPLASSSQLWLGMIDHDDTDADSSPMRDIVAQFVRDWIERQLTEPANPEKPVLPVALPDPAVEQSRVLQGMQKQLRERDRQIEVLRGQLEALKFIDEDHQKQRKVRPPASLKPVENFDR
jgi:TolA-binding protein